MKGSWKSGQPREWERGARRGRLEATAQRDFGQVKVSHHIKTAWASLQSQLAKQSSAGKAEQIPNDQGMSMFTQPNSSFSTEIQRKEFVLGLTPKGTAGFQY